jgi:hypothetical protein
MAELSSPRENLWSTVVLAIAALLTAWTTFQSAKWNGRQITTSAEANRLLTEAAAADNLASTQVAIDVGLFTQWLVAFERERNAEPAERWTPDPARLSGFLYARLRDELKPAMEAWLQTRPAMNPAAPSSPFVMPSYRLAAEDEARRLRKRSEGRAREAREHNLRSDHYVASSVLVSVVLFFAAVGGNLRHRRPRRVALWLSVVFLALSSVLIASLPVALG